MCFNIRVLILSSKNEDAKIIRFSSSNRTKATGVLDDNNIIPKRICYEASKK